MRPISFRYEWKSWVRPCQLGSIAGAHLFDRVESLEDYKAKAITKIVHRIWISWLIQLFQLYFYVANSCSQFNELVFANLFLHCQNMVG